MILEVKEEEWARKTVSLPYMGILTPSPAIAAVMPLQRHYYRRNLHAIEGPGQWAGKVFVLFNLLDVVCWKGLTWLSTCEGGNFLSYIK